MKNKRIFNDEDKSKIIEMHDSGISCEKIGIIFGVSRSTIRLRLQEWGIDTGEIRYVRLTESDKTDILLLWKEGCTCEEISKIYKCSKNSIAIYLKKWGVDISQGIKFSNVIKEKIIVLHKSGYSDKEIGKIIGASKSTIRNYLIWWGEYIGREYYKVNHNFFSIIDTEEKAYWLGFIMADGCVYNNLLIIALKKTEINHLKKLLNNLDSNHKVYIRETRVIVQISSPQIVADLAKYGVIPKKSLVLEPEINMIPDNLIHHFWRGVIDGDGTVAIRTDGPPYIHICGTTYMCYGFKEWCLQYCNSRANVLPTENIFRYAIVGKNSKIIISKLYKDATVYLDRKYEKAIGIITIGNR